MPKPPNNMGTVQITISTTRPVQRYLEELVMSGFYGKNPADAAERLLSQGIKALVKNGTLQAKGKFGGRR
jgi:hypothetical protein